jgi:CheY-like chemotaxis protein
MRANSEWQDIPVIVLTAKDLTDEDRRVLSGRVEQIVEKGASSHEQVMMRIQHLVDSKPPALDRRKGTERDDEQNIIG